MSKIVQVGTSAYMLGSQSIVLTAFNNTIAESFSIDKDAKKISVQPLKESANGIRTDKIDFAEWGEKNALPIEIIKKTHACVQLGANADFNARAGFGQGIMVVKKLKKDGKITFEEQLESEQPTIFEFLEHNNYNRVLYESAIDLDIFSRAYRELCFSRENKLVQIRHKETAYSRISLINDKGKIEYHGYNYYWHTGKEKDKTSVTKLLDEEAPLVDLKVRRGMLPDDKGDKKVEKDTFRYMLPIGLATPARVYYPHPFYWSIFLTKWDQIANLIPLAKQELLKNKIHIAYIVSINETFWDKLYRQDNCTNEEEQKKSRTKFLKKLDQFLAGAENAGKAFLSEFSYDRMKGTELHDIIIKPLGKSGGTVEGGDWIDDNEEATNMICLAKGNHVSLLGAAPGKNKNINGTEARELFIIKQAMLQPLRTELVKDLYLAKAINNWDQDIHFVIPNIELTTIDKGTGAKKSIGNEPL